MRKCCNFFILCWNVLLFTIYFPPASLKIWYAFSWRRELTTYILENFYRSDSCSFVQMFFSTNKFKDSSTSDKCLIFPLDSGVIVRCNVRHVMVQVCVLLVMVRGFSLRLFRKKQQLKLVPMQKMQLHDLLQGKVFKVLCNLLFPLCFFKWLILSVLTLSYGIALTKLLHTTTNDPKLLSNYLISNMKTQMHWNGWLRLKHT
jgi:hypothetical protein